MRYDPDIHHRRSIRLRHYDYAGTGVYFVTICVYGRESLFGDIVDGLMSPNDAGRMVADIWLALPQRFPDLIIDEFTVMPNHFHGIFLLQQPVTKTDSSVGAPLAAPRPAPNPLNQGAASSAPTLGDVVRAFKSISAIAVNRIIGRSGRLWQRNYYERVIRDEAELTNALQYIIDNPARWPDDAENPTNHP
jgi:REP element-mobilizing transposase RayT